MNDDNILGVIGDAEYALVRGDVYRRPAAHAGTYGGWRWECTLEHAKLYPTVYPNGEIVERATMEQALLDAQVALNKALDHLSHAQSFARTDDGVVLIQLAIEAIEQEENEIDGLWEYIQRHAPR